MPTMVNHAPTSAEDFTTQLEVLLAGLEGRDPDKLTDEVIAKHLLDASDDKVEIGRIPDRPTMEQTTFSMDRRIVITKKGASRLNPSFEGTTNDQWSGLSTGALVSIIHPVAANFFVLDGIKPTYHLSNSSSFSSITSKAKNPWWVDRTSMMSRRKFVGKAIYRDLTYTSGQGRFQSF